MRVIAIAVLVLVVCAGQAHAEEPLFDRSDYVAVSSAAPTIHGSSLSLTSVRRVAATPYEHGTTASIDDTWADGSSSAGGGERLALADCCPATANTTAAPRKRWHVILGAYIWATDISGTSYTDGEATDVDASFDDLFDKLDYSYMGYVEGRYDRWSLAVDASTLKLIQTRTGPLQNANLTSELTQTLIDVRLGYMVLCRKVGSDRWGRCCYPRHMTLDAIVGARHWDFESETELAVTGGPVIQVENESDWWDPYVGARFRWQFAKRWGLMVYGDVGGFGVGNASDSTWQVQALLRFNITRGLFVGLGYRALNVDRVTGSGASKNGVDATYSGPLIGLGYIF